MVSGQEFHNRIELVDTLKSHGDDQFFRIGLTVQQIDGNVVSATLSGGKTAMLYADPVLLP